MNETESEKATSPSPIVARIDPPHRKAESPLPDSLAVTLAEQIEGQGAEQVLIHAGQLAGHLRGRQRDLDRREAQLNSRTAQLDKDIRASRMWFQEREKEAAQRELELQQQIGELEERAAAIAASDISSEREDEVADREQARKKALDKAEDLLNRQFATLKTDREQLSAEREQYRKQRADDEIASIRREKKFDAALAKKKRQLDHRSKFLDNREATMDQLQREVSRLHRESLEMRFIVEQLWTQLAGKIAPAQLTKSISETRRKLSQHFQIESSRLEQQRDCLAELTSKLDSRKQQLQQQRTELEAWTQRRQLEIEEQAARLVAREQELDRQDQIHLETQQQWDDERRELERHIREIAKENDRRRQFAA